MFEQMICGGEKRLNKTTACVSFVTCLVRCSPFFLSGGDLIIILGFTQNRIQVL